jgi:hypothetical protein
VSLSSKLERGETPMQDEIPSTGEKSERHTLTLAPGSAIFVRAPQPLREL